MALRPRRQRRLRAALIDANVALDADWPIQTTWSALAANTARFLARDYPIDRQSDEAVLRRFEVRGYDRLNTTLAAGRGAILVGSHLGAHIAGVHWLFRRGVPLRLLVQRPRHVSRELNCRFDAGEPHPQAALFLRRDLSPAVAIERVFRARAALRDGMAIYLNGDIPWVGPNTCAGILLGRAQRFLAIWTELAVLTNAPVFLVFCTHSPGGRFALEIEAIGHLHPGDEDTAVADYLKQLEARIATCPADAVAHLGWPCYQSPPSSAASQHVRRRAETGSESVGRTRN
jgi:phosphatidylinositol dimannoside acyltransferase